MVKERYLWVAFIVIIIAAALAYKVYNQAQIELNVTVLSYTSQLYPYQTSSIPIQIVNGGPSAISNLSFGLYLNGNVTRTYKVSMPSGSKTVLYYNYTAAAPGNYNISIVADPAKLYNIVDRQNAQASAEVYVLTPQALAPYAYFPSNGLLGKDMFSMSALGYISSTYFYSNFSTNLFELSGSSSVNNFIYPAIDVYLAYIKQIYVAHAYYPSYSLVSIWMNGYLGNGAIYEAALGKNLNATNNDNMTFINLGNSSTMCSWYSNGWTKSLISIGGRPCTSFLGNTSGTFSTNKDYSLLRDKNSSVLNYSGDFGNLTYAGDMFTYNSILLYESVMGGINFSNLCYGSITTENDVSYCTTYEIGTGNYVLTKVAKLVGGYNISAMGLSTQNSSQEGYDYAASLAYSYNVVGTSIPYQSAFSDRCALAGSLACYNASFNSTIFSFSLKNNYNGTVKITGVSCNSESNVTTSALDISIAPGANAIVKTACYAGSQQVTGVPLGFQPQLIVNYNLDSTSTSAYGYAYIYG